MLNLLRGWNKKINYLLYLQNCNKLTINLFKDSISALTNFTFEDGIWYSSNSNKLSYPEDGNEAFFEIEENSFWFRHRNNCLISLIKKYSPDNMFFDVGGGNGFVTKAIDNAQIPTVLIEPGKQGVLNAKNRNLANIVCGTLSDLNGLAGQISSIGSFDVIEHIQDDNKFVKEIHVMLQNGGVFFVTVPAFQFLWSDEDKDAGHFRRYSLKAISKLLKNNGFEVAYSTYFFSLLILPLFLIRTLKSKFKIRGNSKTQVRNEHTQDSGFIGKIMDLIWKWELGRINKLK